MECTKLNCPMQAGTATNNCADNCPWRTTLKDGDLISRAGAIAEIEDYIEEYSEVDEKGYHNLKWCAMEEAKEVLLALPVVDAVPVVRCRDCKYAHMTYDGEVKYCDIISMPDADGDYGYALYLPGDWFCADGERREADG